MAFPSTQGKTVTFNLDHNPACFCWRPESTCPLLSAQSGVIFQNNSNNHLLLVPLTFTKWPSFLQIEWICSLSGRRVESWPCMCSNFYSYPTLGNLLTPLSQRSSIFQGQRALLLCRDWSLHRLHPTHCNYSVPLIWHFFKQGLLLTLLHGRTPLPKQCPSQGGEFGFPQSYEIWTEDSCNTGAVQW